MKMRVLIFFVLGLTALCGSALAELYQYVDENGVLHITDDPGSVPERARKPIKIIEDNDHGSSSTTRGSNRAPDVNGQSRVDTGRRPSGPPAARTALPGPAQQISPVPQQVQPASSHQQLATVGTDTRNSSAIDEFFASRFRSMLEEKFKDVKDPAQIAAMNADTSIDCTNYKKNMDEDLTNMDSMIKVVKKRRAQGDSEVLIKLQVIWGLRHIVNMLYDAVVTPKHCQDEFGRENKERLADLNKELAGAQK